MLGDREVKREMVRIQRLSEQAADASFMDIDPADGPLLANAAAFNAQVKVYRNALCALLTEKYGRG